MSLVFVLATLPANTHLVVATKQVQRLLVFSTRSGLHLGQRRVNAAPLRPRTWQDVQVDRDGRWRRAAFHAVRSQFLHSLHQHCAFSQRGPRLEHLPTLRAAALAAGVLLVPVTLNAGQAVGVSAGQCGRLLQSVEAHRADKRLLLRPGRGHPVDELVVRLERNLKILVWMGPIARKKRASKTNHSQCEMFLKMNHMLLKKQSTPGVELVKQVRWGVFSHVIGSFPCNH